MDKSEYYPILRQLEQHHALFGRFWSVGSLVEDEKIPTACIQFDKETGQGVQFRVNPTFWAECSFYKKVWVIAHECMHVYLEHGKRMKFMTDKRIANMAADVVDNHYLSDGFGFDRTKVEGWEKYCWMDTVFPNDPTVLPNQSLEYYYNRLMKDAQASPKRGGKGEGEGKKGSGGKGDGKHDQEIVDGHEELEDIAEEIIEEVTRQLSQEELEQFEQTIQDVNSEEQKEAEKVAGSAAGNFKKIIQLGKVVKKKKWETVIKNVLARFCMEKEITIEQWAYPNRRLVAIDHDMMLPADRDVVDPAIDKIDVWFFQDTSGSCEHLAERFFKAAASLPDKFRIRMFCFDTNTYETSLKSGKLYGFGGTTFSCIEERIQHTIRTEKGTQYPSVVFVVTDGYGSGVSPEHPDRWYWFLSERYTRFIPPKSKFYDLKDYE